MVLVQYRLAEQVLWIAGVCMVISRSELARQSPDG